MQKLFTFDPVIYPRMVYIAVGRENFDDIFDEVGDFQKNAKAQCDYAYNKIDEKGGVLLRFASLEDMDFKTVTHESLHTAMMIYEYIGAKVEVNNQEPTCYLAGWVAKCCDEVKNKLTIK